MHPVKATNALANNTSRFLIFWLCSCVGVRTYSAMFSVLLTAGMLPSGVLVIHLEHFPLTAALLRDSLRIVNIVICDWVFSFTCLERMDFRKAKQIETDQLLQWIDVQNQEYYWGKLIFAITDLRQQYWKPTSTTKEGRLVTSRHTRQCPTGRAQESSRAHDFFRTYFWSVCGFFFNEKRNQRRKSPQQNSMVERK